MAETVACPSCKAGLMLPSLPKGQSVQCPRCLRVFEPGAVPLPPPLSSSVPSNPVAVQAPEGADEPLPPVARYQPLRGEWKAYAAMLSLALSLLSYGLQLYVNYERSQLIQLEDGAFGRQRVGFAGGARIGRIPQQNAELDRRAFHIRNLATLADVIHHVTYWPAVVLVLIWLHQASWALRILRADALIHSPSTAVLAFFIPLLNLVQPFMVMQEIWRASDPHALKNPRSWRFVPGSRMIIAWWIALLGAAFFGLAARFISRDDAFGFDNDDRLLSARLWCISNIAMLIAGAALIAIINGIRVRQRGRHARIYDDVT